MSPVHEVDDDESVDLDDESLKNKVEPVDEYNIV